jgi:hypothetical protein
MVDNIISKDTLKKLTLVVNKKKTLHDQYVEKYYSAKEYISNFDYIELKGLSQYFLG